MSESPFDLSGKVALVTGANTGLGQGMAVALAEAGADIALIGRSEPTQTLEQIAKLGVKSHSILTDLGNADNVADIIAEAATALGRADILVNNAGVSVVEDMENVTPEGLDFTLNVNVRNLILLTRELTPALIKSRGNIVNISSVSSFSGGLGQIAYAASKGAINSFTRNASIDLGRSGVRVNAVAPGVIDDGMWKTAFESGIDREKTMKKMRRLLPFEGRWGSAQNVADAVAWLASDKAGYVTGQVIRVDGGMIV